MSQLGGQSAGGGGGGAGAGGGISIQQFAAWTQQWIARLNQQQVKLAQRVAGVEVRAVLSEAGRRPRMPMRFTSQYGEDLLLWALFEGQLEGFYIEVGAYDGKFLSVSYAFDAMGWRGLLVEALPEVAARCRANRPSARVEQCALSKPGSAGTTTFYSAGGVGGQGNDAGGTVFSYHQPTAAHMQLLQQQKVESRAITVPVTTMDELLKGHEGGVDFVVIDVEGGEADLLAGFDVGKWRPRVMLVEDNTRGQDGALNAYFAGREYELMGWVEVSRVYIRNDERELKERYRGYVGV